MKKELLSKILVIGVIALSVVISFQPALAVEPKLSVENIEKEEDCDCKDDSISDFPGIKDFLTESKNFSNNILTILGYNPRIIERCKGLLEIINGLRPLCFNIGLIVLFIAAFEITYELAAEKYNGTLKGIIYRFIADFFQNKYLRWVSIYEDVFKCGEWPPQNILVKLNEKQSPDIYK